LKEKRILILKEEEIYEGKKLKKNKIIKLEWLIYYGMWFLT
jgi:hypothetical protein